MVILNMNTEQAVGMAIIFSGLKELTDEAYKRGWFGKPDSGHWFLDARGFDVFDMIECILGAFVAVMILHIWG